MSAPKTAKSVPANCQPHVWKQLIALYGQRGTAKNRVSDRTKHRDLLKKELREMGRQSTTERKEKAEELWDTEESLRKERDRVGWLADQYDEVLDNGLQGKLYEPPQEMDDEAEAKADTDDDEEEPELVRNARLEREERAAQDAGQDKPDKFTFPGAFVLKAERHGVAPIRLKAERMVELTAAVKTEIVRSTGVEKPMVAFDVFTGEVRLGKEIVARVSQVADDAELDEKPAAPEPAPKPLKPLKEVRDSHVRPRKPRAAKTA